MSSLKPFPKESHQRKPSALKPAMITAKHMKTSSFVDDDAHNRQWKSLDFVEQEPEPEEERQRNWKESLFRGRTNSSMGEDPHHLIEHYTNDVVPEWVDAESQTNCVSCTDLFKKGRRHNCRLCGKLYCSNCTGKYHVPGKFKKKGKRGAVRVCWGCRNGCTARHLDVEPEWVNPYRRPRMVVYRIGEKEHIFTPRNWAEIGSYSYCWTCNGRLGSHPFNCRVCGEMFCKECTMKMDMPYNFKKRGKSGAVRICLECQFRVRSGAELDPGDVLDERDMQTFQRDAEAGPPQAPPQSGPPPPLTGAPPPQSGPPQSGPPQARAAPPQVRRQQSGPPHAGVHRPQGGIPTAPIHTAPNDKPTPDYFQMRNQNKNGNAQLEALLAVQIKKYAVFKARRDPTPNEFVMDIEMKSDATLVQVNDMLLKKCAFLKDVPYHFVIRGKPVYQEHWGLLKPIDPIVLGPGPPPEPQSPDWTKFMKNNQSVKDQSGILNRASTAPGGAPPPPPANSTPNYPPAFSAPRGGPPKVSGGPPKTPGGPPRAPSGRPGPPSNMPPGPPSNNAPGPPSGSPPPPPGPSNGNPPNNATRPNRSSTSWRDEELDGRMRRMFEERGRKAFVEDQKEKADVEAKKTAQQKAAAHKRVSSDPHGTVQRKVRRDAVKKDLRQQNQFNRLFKDTEDEQKKSEEENQLLGMLVAEKADLGVMPPPPPTKANESRPKEKLVFEKKKNYLNKKGVVPVKARQQGKKNQLGSHARKLFSEQ